MNSPPASARDLTGLLLAWQGGDANALDQLMPLVYQELHRLAHAQMRDERRPDLLQTTALIHEAYVRLIDASRVPWQNRAHFFAIAARAMRRVLVDEARARAAQKRGGAAERVEVGDFVDGRSERHDLVALDDALTALEQVHARRAKVVELRYFGGLSVEEAAEALRVSTDTVTRDWNRARLWLLWELGTRP